MEAILRTYIQKCSNANFIFSGSERHLISKMFSEKAHPFYNRALDEMEAHKKNGTKPMSFDDFMAKLDERPRKKLNFSTPKECFYKNIS